MGAVIRAEGVSKAYQIGQFNTGALAHDLQRWFAIKRGKPDPFLKLGEVNDRTSKGKNNIVWSLQDLSFQIDQGDAVGIVGRNGAGKSTLLKILAQITSPTKGEVKIKGRIASLLEVGTGFHPELSGRENIYLNGAILGMRKSEIKRQFDAIVDFAGVERYIDTPVKRYSSGMYVRLAFAVAAHLESEILIVDEVLAVGDAEFQRKCLGKMNEMSRGAGRTVLFVSHNLASIKALCNSCILLKNGRFLAHDETEKVLEIYQNTESITGYENNFTLGLSTNSSVLIHRISLNNDQGELLKSISTETNIYVHITCSPTIDTMVGFTLIVKDLNDSIIFSSISNSDKEFTNIRRRGTPYISVCHIPAALLNDETYKISIVTFNHNFTNSYLAEDLLQFKVDDGETARRGYTGKFSGLIRPALDWYSKYI